MNTNQNSMCAKPALDANKWDEYLRERAKELPSGVHAAEVYASQAQSFSVGLQDGEIEDYEFSRSGGVCMRVDCGQVGYSYSEHPQQDPEALFTRALDNAYCVESEDAPYMRFYEGASTDGYPVIPPVDPRLSRISAAEKIEKLRELEKLALAQDPRIVRLENCVLSTSTSETIIQNTLGLRVKEQSAYAVAYCSPIAEQQDEVKNGFAYDIARSVEELDLHKIAREAAEDTLSQLGASSVASGAYAIVMKNQAMNSLFGHFSSMFSAEAAQKGLSLLAGREGQTIASAILEIVDDPMHPLSLFPSAFDAEGVPAQRTVLVQNGLLCSLLHNRATAQKAGVQTTGNAVKGSIASPISVAPTNFVVLPGEKSEEELFALMGNGLYITDLSGLHAGANAISGSFSLLARGFEIKNGGLGKAVEQITLSGHFLELMQKAQAVGSNLRFGLGSVASPSVLFDAVQIAGK